jgi:hypothetical protein
MAWHQFRYIFNREVENAMRYSIHEALRRHQRGTVGAPEAIAEDAIGAFKRKMEKHCTRATADPALDPATVERCASEAEWEGYGETGRVIAKRIRALASGERS